MKKTTISLTVQQLALLESTIKDEVICIHDTAQYAAEVDTKIELYEHILQLLYIEKLLDVKND